MDDGIFLTDAREHVAANGQAPNRKTKLAVNFKPRPQSRCARIRRSSAVTQLAYARQGIITPEMEFIAIRENSAAKSRSAESQMRIANDATHPRTSTIARNALPSAIAGSEPIAIGSRHSARNHTRIRPRRSRARPRHHSCKHQSSRIRADDHRPQFPGKDQREHRQQRRGVVDRGRSRENALGDEMGRRHGDGSVHRKKHSRHARMDHPQLSRADRNCADLPGARKSRRTRGGTDLGNLSRHVHRTGRARCRLFYGPCGRASALTSR